MRSPIRFCCVLGVLLAAGCHATGRLIGGRGKLQAPQSFDLGKIYQGALSKQQVDLGNATGTAALALSLSLMGDPQILLPAGTQLVIPQGTSVSLAVAVQAQRLGPFSGTLDIGGDATAQVALSGVVIPDLGCPPPGPCLQSQFDPNQGLCLTQASGDGQPCDDGDPCTTDKICSSGQCKGVPKNCDDRNVCTVDYCQKGLGCQHLDESGSCAGADDPCQVAYCDPNSGCQRTPAADGTPCAAQVACVNANVCLGGACTGLPVPNGTPCLPPKNPCATDGTCQQGLCDSPTADKLVPGALLWQRVSRVYSDGDGGSTWTGDGGPDVLPDAGPQIDTGLGWRAAAASDSQGNLYLDDLLPAPVSTLDKVMSSPGDLVSLDVCGRERWRVSYPSATQWTNGRHLLVGGVVISVGADQTLAGMSQATGATLWTFDPKQQAGLDNGQASSFRVGDVALSNSGILFYTARWTSSAAGDGGPQLGRLIGGVLRNGQSKFQSVLAAMAVDDSNFPNAFGYPLMVDENENLYTAMDLSAAQAEILSYDQTGGQRFALPLPGGRLDSLAENQGIFVEPTTATAFDNLGNVLWTHADSQLSSNTHSPVIGMDGHVTLPRRSNATHQGFIASYAADGTLLWQTPFGNAEGPQSSVVLDGQGVVYLVTDQRNLLAFATSDGHQVWSRALPTLAPAYEGVLALTPAGSLVASVSERLFGLYAGNQLANAPWPRFRGNNGNTSAPAIAGGTPP